MLKALFSSPLKLGVDGRTITFNSLTDFEFSLASRTEMPSAKISELVKLSAEALLKEATDIRQVEKRFVSVLAESMEEPGSITRLMRSLDRKLFSQDHSWRSIMSALNEQGAEYDEFKKMALIKYMQYLSLRQDVLKSIYANVAQGVPSPLEETAVAPNAALRETVIFDLTEAGAAGNQRPFERLPKGETVTVKLPDSAELDLMLSRNAFKLVGGSRFYLVDEEGSDYLLGDGKNLVGRDLGNEVAVNPSYRDVSRVHLVIEPLDERTVRVTDLSSHGTFVPPGSVVASLPVSAAPPPVGHDPD